MGIMSAMMTGETRRRYANFLVELDDYPEVFPEASIFFHNLWIFFLGKTLLMDSLEDKN